MTIVTGENITNVNGTLAGSTLVAHANTDLTNLAGKITADNAMLTAGRDVSIASQTWSAQTFSNATQGLGALSTINVGNLALGAGRDVNITASRIDASGNALISAARDVNLTTAQVSDSQHATFDGRNQRATAQSADVGSTIQTGGACHRRGARPERDRRHRERGRCADRCRRERCEPEGGTVERERERGPPP